ncbi:hypothetical protein Syun_015305 [Stephania yunnanensis]|uniref:Uncharacterized protein n=1 Tax=Stephania yunnanensis TaxID=152371 RepID=A0AAP0JN49_9MAGN
MRARTDSQHNAHDFFHLPRLIVQSHCATWKSLVTMCTHVDDSATHQHHNRALDQSIATSTIKRLTH